MKDKKEECTAEDVLRKFKKLLDNSTLGGWDIYDALEEEFAKKPPVEKSFWEKLWN